MVIFAKFNFFREIALDKTVGINKQRLLDLASKGVSQELFKKEIIGITSEELWTARKQNSSVPPVNKEQISINIDFHSLDKCV